MKVATLEKFHLRRGNQDPGDPGVGKVRGGGKDFFSFKQGGDWLWMTLCLLSHTQFMLEKLLPKGIDYYATGLGNHTWFWEIIKSDLKLVNEVSNFSG